MTSADPLGSGIVRRLAARELGRLQRAFLQDLGRSNLAPHLTLCGSGALHGVHLHGRDVADLDFIAPADVALRFPALGLAAGLGVRRGNVIDTYSVGKQSTIYRDLCLQARVSPSHGVAADPEMGSYQASDGSATPVRVLGLTPLTGLKLATVRLRGAPLDFWDVWYALRTHPELLASVRDFLAKQATARNRSSHSPPYPFHAKAALERLERVKGIWVEQVAFVKEPVSYETVHADLALWLPELDSRLVGNVTLKPNTNREHLECLR